MTAAEGLIKMAQKFIAEKLKECGLLTTGAQRASTTTQLAGKLGELQKLGAAMEQEKAAVAQGVIKSRIWAELAEVKVMVSSSAEQGIQLAERLTSLGQGDVSAEI